MSVLFGCMSVQHMCLEEVMMPWNWSQDGSEPHVGAGN